MKFVRFGDIAINMDNVKSIRMQKFDDQQTIRIDFVDGNYERLYKDNVGVYEETAAWIKEQPHIIRDLI